MNLYIYLSAFDVLSAPVHVQHGRLVLIRERVVEVVVYQACFTDGSISHKNYFDLLLAICGLLRLALIFFHFTYNCLHIGIFGRRWVGSCFVVKGR